MKRPYDKSEHDIQNEIIEFLENGNMLYIRINAGKIKKGRYMIMLAKEGSPDLLVFRRGITYAIEVKDSYGEQSPKQVEFQTRFEKLGHTYFIARNLEDVVERIR